MGVSVRGSESEGRAGRPLRVLLVEDDQDDARMLIRALTQGGYELISDRVQTADAMREALSTKTWDLVLSDYSMPSFSAPAALALLKSSTVDIPFIIVSGTIGEEVAVTSLHAGADDFLVKGKLSRLVPAIERALRESEQRRGRDAAEKELQRAEEHLRQAQKMEAVGRLAGGVAHDFNNILSVVLSYTGMILADLKDDDPMRSDLEQVHKAGRRAADMTRQLLAFCRQQILQPKVLDLNPVLLGMQEMTKRLLGVDVEVTLLHGTNLGRIWADPGQVEQIVMNLVVNARDAMPKGGKLTIRTSNAQLDAEYAGAHPGVVAGRYVLLSVTDTGVGMDKETVARVFEPFFTTKERGRGTGLGLSTVFGIVKQSDGHIAVHSEPGKGTTFKVYFPRTDAVAQTISSRPHVAEESGGSETILLVEDDEQVRAVARDILRRVGYTVLEAPSAGEALLASEQHAGTVHLLLTDVVLPRISGQELASRLASTRPDMKVLFMSGCSDEAVVQRAVVDSGFACMQKPLTPETLAKRVRETLDRAGV